MKQYMPVILLIFASTCYASGAYIQGPSVPPHDPQYYRGQAAFGGRGLPGGRSCRSCHGGGLSRGRLMRVRGRLSGIIASCKTHKVYCKGSKTRISGGTIAAIVHYLKRRYQIR